ncbi:RraA family protein [Thalassococcus lentus]|uniref:Putative 4-hydroxy-4-methyl-2-oxoglutarate aldolase n=1 Tax=Thalassococcus lentus TaxID=1210524 RepID=A0ABT4XR40_9RHOB|nr:RraA family protein [Thalassococcus lentus]MDA7424367.1 RraA family protein [Thalassococcus lentus]
MIELPATLSVNPTRSRPSAEQIAAFQSVPTGFVADALGGGGALEQQVAQLDTSGVLPAHVAGPALTADNGPADVLATFAALPLVQEGDVVIGGFSGHLGCAAGGDRLCGMLRNCGAAGFVTDGPVRDFDGILAAGLPVWCAGITPASPYMSGPGRVGYAVQVAGQQIETGDMIVADRDGVVVVAFARIDEVIERLETIKVQEAELDAKVAAGLKWPSWVDDLT